jgi:hypothetical protein
MTRGLYLGAVTLVVVALLSGSAEGAYDPVARGATEIDFASSFLRALRGADVKLEVRDGERHAGRVTLQAMGGEVDPRAGKGTIENRGTIIFAAGGRKVILRSVVFKAKRVPMYAKVGGGKLKLATAGGLAWRRAGFGAAFTARGLRLSSKLATRLDKKLRLGHALFPGQLLGTVRVEAQPATVHLRQEGRLYLALAPAFAAKLNALFVSLNPVAPAELAGGPTLSFPVGAESALAPDAATGVVKLGGQVELLQLGSAQMFWREIWLEPASAALFAETDVEPVPPNPGALPQGPLLSVSADGTVSSDPKARTISIAGRSAVLTSSAAKLLNDAFADGASSFSAGEPVGAVSLAGRAE